MYNKILFPVDLNAEESQEKALATALQLAEKFNASLDIMTVVPDFSMNMVSSYFPADYEENMLEEVKGRLNEYISENVSDGSEIHAVVAHGSIYNEILNHAEDSGTDLIVMASHRPELKDYLVGPNASRVVRHAKCSTMVVRS